MIKICQGVVNERVERAVFAGKVTVKRLAGNVHLLAQVADRNVFVISMQHQLQKALLQLPLAKGRLLRLAILIHVTRASLLSTV